MSVGEMPAWRPDKRSRLSRMAGAGGKALVRVESTDVSATVVVAFAAVVVTGTVTNVVVAIVEVTPASGPQATTPRREATRYAAAPQ